MFSKVSFSEFFMVYETQGSERGLHKLVFFKVYIKWYFQKVSFLVCLWFTKQGCLNVVYEKEFFEVYVKRCVRGLRN
jgi:hypothetical protein